MRRRKRSAPLNPLGGCLLIIAGLMLMGGVYWVHTMQLEFARISTPTTGTVIELVKGSGKSKNYYPVIQFLTAREHVYSFKSPLPTDYQVGDQVEVLYNPEAPEQAVMAAENSISTNRAMWIFAAVGAVLVVIGVSPFARMLKWLRKKIFSQPSEPEVYPEPPITTI